MAIVKITKLRYELSTAKVEKDLNYKPLYTFKESFAHLARNWKQEKTNKKDK